MREIEQIRKNLMSSTASLSRMGPYAPQWLVKRVNDEWRRLFALQKQIDARQQRAGKRDNLGLLPLILVAGGVFALSAGASYISKLWTDTSRTKAITECIEQTTKEGTTLEEAQKRCVEIYGGAEKSFLEKLGFSGTSLILFGVIAIGAIYLIKKL